MAERRPLLSRGEVDRAAERRNDDAWLTAAWDDDSSRVLVLHDGAVVVDDEGSRPRLALRDPAAAPSGERYLLGVDAGIAYFAVASPERPAGVRLRDLREVGGLLDGREAGLLVHAVALERWHSTHPCCPRCGAATRVERAGHARICPQDGSEHFPRLDPAVIMMVHDGGDRCVLGRQPGWPPRMFSTLAGFVEPGESVEQAVVREVAEEVGLTVTSTAYVASQPWPFPSSLMLGFTARVGGGSLVLRDGELDDARWFSRTELREAVRTGTVHLPPPVSIARHLLDSWLGAG